MKKFIQDFKEFALKGNVMDMAIGVIIGGAFGKIVTSLVDDVIMPLVTRACGGMDLTQWKWVLAEGTANAEGVMEGEIAVQYGNFIQTAIDFLIIALCIFLAIKGIAKMNRKKKEEEAAEEAPAEPSDEAKLLTEIRDLLKKD
ncbi:MAG: large-conductance mechanosensitive channel protein MscL [Muribaculaceae bacterium]|nr:large-conductance mechanosensitive channel protein MscL [Muribaculaceae bacterium]MBR5436399.1 large-conductance mechanosensitive channel protein MscL [Muribaculaceae bacterium]